MHHLFLLLLFHLAIFSHMADANVFTAPAQLDASACPVLYFGELYSTVYVNITDGKIAVCFKAPFSPGTMNDCVLTPQLGAESGVWYARSLKAGPQSPFHQALPQLTGSSTCEFALLLGNTTHPQSITFSFRQFETQSAVELYFMTQSMVPLPALLEVDGIQVIERNDPDFYVDLSGCRHEGVLYYPDTGVCDSEGNSIFCNDNAALSTGPCGPKKSCQHGGRCTLEASCTLTGSTLIDLADGVTSVPDCCAYTLLSDADVQVLAFFQERRRKDVSFLDRVILRLDGPGVDIHLGQGGRVEVNNTKLSLDAPLHLHGVELSKDQTGVTVKMKLSNHNMSVFFDGYTAQIYLTGPGGGTLQGLCSNSSRPLSEMRLTEHSMASCEMQHSEPADDTINCTTVTEHCSLLKEAPFSSCHGYTDPEPFVTACTNTLCYYPDVDGLRCQFLEAYARACSLHSNVTLEDWRSKAGCSSPQAFCQDTFCSSHEFCGDDLRGGTSCLCRAIFASRYRSMDTLGEPTVCGQNSASVSLVGCLLEEKLIDYSILHLVDQNCTGHMDEESHMVTFSFDRDNTCGTVVTGNNSQIIYKNTIMTSAKSQGEVIHRHNQVAIDFSCFYGQPNVKTMSFRIKDSSVIQQIVSGTWNYTLFMKAYTDADRTQPIESSTGIQLKQMVWVELETDGLDDKVITVVTDSCWATNQPSPNGNVRYNLIINGCPNPRDQTVQVVANGLGTSNYFSFSMFQFQGSAGDLYLHCKLNLCVKDKNKTCAPSCNHGKRRRRSARSKYEDEEGVFITMAWTN
ncbi:alpha-tectorin-like [Mugil cephalus]|uniref:alpha-tectorin-like n=1 Tax=Mugil cephalus TaxID=48193 RepID=UPI001FB5BBCB|nr:alpha-tectorin-like [Mugil cephalus]